MLALAAGFAERGVDVDLVLVEATGEYLGMVPDDVRVIDLDSQRTYFAIPKFLRYIRRERPYALLSTLLTTDLGALLAKLIQRGRLRVVVRQATTFSDTLNDVPFKTRQLMRLARLLMPAADAIVAVSEGAASDLRGQVPRAAGKIVTIHNPVVGPGLDGAGGGGGGATVVWRRGRAGGAGGGPAVGREGLPYPAAGVRGGGAVAAGAAGDSGTGSRAGRVCWSWRSGWG